MVVPGVYPVERKPEVVGRVSARALIRHRGLAISANGYTEIAVAESH